MLTYRPKLLAYFKSEDLPKVYGGKCECEGGCVLGRAAHDVRCVVLYFFSFPFLLISCTYLVSYA